MINRRVALVKLHQSLSYVMELSHSDLKDFFDDKEISDIVHLYRHLTNIIYQIDDE